MKTRIVPSSVFIMPHLSTQSCQLYSGIARTNTLTLFLRWKQLQRWENTLHFSSSRNLYKFQWTLILTLYCFQSSTSSYLNHLSRLALIQKQIIPTDNYRYYQTFPYLGKEKQILHYVSKMNITLIDITLTEMLSKWYTSITSSIMCNYMILRNQPTTQWRSSI